MKITTKKMFRSEIKKLIEENDVSIFDAILHYCSQNNIEFETVKKLISPRNES